MVDGLSRFGRLQRLGRLARKELSEILRDRRTMITLFLMPLLLYPLLSVAFQQFYRALDLGRGPEYRIGFRSPEEIAFFERTLAYIGPRLSEIPKIVAGMSDDPNADLLAGRVDLVLSIPNLDRKINRRLDWKTTTVEKSLSGSTAQVWIERIVAAANARSLDEEIAAHPGRHFSVALERTTVRSSEGDGMVNFAAVIPLILILMTITGAVYPAIDLTAGERERNTLEILVAAPVPRLSLLFAKYVSVLTIAVLTALVNMVAMTFTVVTSGLGAALFGASGLSPLLLVQLFLLLLLFASFFSAVLLGLCSFARSFKEAQAYLVPLMLFSLAPGMIGLMPGLNMTPYLAVAPLLNIVLLARDLLGGAPGHAPIDPFLALLVVGSTLLYAAAAIGLAARVFGDEGVLYNEQTSWSDLFRKRRESRPEATAAAGLWCLALMLPLFFALQIVARQFGVEGIWALAIVPVAFAALLFVAWPTLFAWLGGVRWRTGFGVVPARTPAILGALILGASFWPVLFWGMQFVRFEMSEAFREQYEQLIARFKEVDAPTRIAVALAMGLQGIMEELFFRGFLFRSLRTAAKPAVAILASSLLFGLVHLAMGGPLGIERVLPSTILGVLLAWVAWMSDSAVPGMALHAVHNGLLIGLGLHTVGAADSISLPQLGLGLGGTFVGVALVWWGRARPRPEPETHSEGIEPPAPSESPRSD